MTTDMIWVLLIILQLQWLRVSYPTYPTRRGCWWREMHPSKARLYRSDVWECNLSRMKNSASVNENHLVLERGFQCGLPITALKTWDPP